MCVVLWRAQLRFFHDQRHRLWFQPQGVVPVALVLRLVLRCVAVVRVLGALLTRCGVCGSVRGFVALVSVLRRAVVVFRVLPSLCSLSSGCSLPVAPGCAGCLGAAVGVPFGRCVGVSGFFLLCAVHRVCGAGGVCVRCPPSASIAGAVEVVGVAPRHVAVVCVLAIFRALQAQGTLACRVACGSVCGAGAVVGTL